MAWLTGWSYRKSITLSRASGAVTNYQMKLLVGESSGATGEDVDCVGHCASDFDDIRFTADDGTTLLDYWIEFISGTTPNQLATIWIEFNSIGTGATTFYMYYGKSDAAAVSSGANTFIFFDNFSGDLSLWDDQAGTWGIVSGKMKGTNAGSTSASILSNSQISVSDNYAVDADINAQYGLVTGNYQSGLIMNDEKTNATMMRGYWLDLSGYDKWAILDQDSGLDLSSADTSFDARTVTKYSLRKNGTDHKLYINDSLKVSHTYSWGTAPRYVGCYVAYSANYAYFENFRVRQYLATEPAWGSWGSEESSGLSCKQMINNSLKVSSPKTIMVNGIWKSISSGKLFVNGAWKTLN